MSTNIERSLEQIYSKSIVQLRLYWTTSRLDWWFYRYSSSHWLSMSWNK